LGRHESLSVFLNFLISGVGSSREAETVVYFLIS
jgi:hypothetical protein